MSDKVLVVEMKFWDKAFNPAYSKETVNLLESKISRLNIDMDALRTEKLDLIEERFKLNKEINRLKESHSSELEELETKLKESEDLVGKLQGENMVLETKNATLETNAKTLTENAGKVNTKLEIAQNDVKELKQTIKDNAKEHKLAIDTIKSENSKAMQKQQKEFADNMLKVDKDASVRSLTDANTALSDDYEKLMDAYEAKTGEVFDPDAKEEIKEKVTEPITKDTKKKVGVPAFTCPQIKDIRTRAKAGESEDVLATEYKVHRTTISRIVDNKTYKKCK